MAELARLGLFVAQAERQGQPAREGAPAEVEHASPLHPAVTHQGDVGGAAADIDEDAAFRPHLLTCASTRQRVSCATAEASSRSSSRTTVTTASMRVIGANVLKTVTSPFFPVKPTALV